MQLGLVGLGRMGSGMRGRLRQRGHDVIGFDPHSSASDVTSLEALVQALSVPRTVWVMVPAGAPTREVIGQLSRMLSRGDRVVDGGNTRFTEDRIHAEILAHADIRLVDCGVSGGVRGETDGYALMVGGHPTDVSDLMPIFEALCPDGERADSFVHAGPLGAGHYAKMVHNGVEYGLMQAYAEGFELLAAEELITDVPAVLRAWSRGTVVRSWLLDLLVDAVSDEDEFSRVSGYVEDSGEGRWTVEEALRHAVPAPVISAALFARFASRQSDSPAMRAVAALRRRFGGHPVRTHRPPKE
ncbi:decarboxylating 6-phosphogluconate dehydrogenase [Nocardia cyriacigeorgica]|uniref:phosphogluconate dehydrogenase (NAD(+)-dependent, decarboxylating) n=1 Tax=Nocardia cyriacigeorgica TaxID=135487 RepID=UPI001893C50D|nr:decarboxylating 6-phosphogluconate dehydrogenase [Nocardia cyriacigeorgica]MBF6102072.1 decarboxylating 6-phosphogluconate dehydrogenase [Nocardia cyriacigeorgica]MBF6162971.1 decarboxylating 6-phosphogluconate dehydrogenase [Nocardia cyriacigeorgica]MBF6201938.1 decarboxylating 6-phosphogluconate dehydrogenase [Nocardia cyriacigeorgica]MBF6320821.1 decarboxylating 6-phosphogluconate dehydrogenase [Nocardia cyriacigeorgica]MBF6518368.1 decarboxylating 6-phosphogluconate dehydrogenase [Nocar